MMRNKKLIGLTGNSGSGKSTVASVLKDYAYVIDADAIAHNVYDIGTKCYDEVVAHFGIRILNDDKTISRKKLSAIVFDDIQQVKILSEITHKYIKKIIYDEIDYIKNNLFEHSYIVVDAPILVGTDLYDAVDEVWVCYADYETMIQRIVNRDNITREDAVKRLDKQQDSEMLKTYADVLIHNENKTIKQLSAEIKMLLNR